jgi:predicted secreted protein
MSIIKRIIAFFMTILAFFGIGKGNNTEPQEHADDVAACTVEQHEVTFSFFANATTGYSWEYTPEGDSIALTDERYETPDADPRVAGAPGRQYYTFTAVKPGATTVTFTYARPWETDPPVYTYVAVISVDADLNLTVESFHEAVLLHE